MIVGNAIPLPAFARIDIQGLPAYIVPHLAMLLPPFIYRYQRPRRLGHLLAQALWLQHLGVGTPLQHPPAYFAGLTDLNCKDKTAVGEIVDLLRGMPARLCNVLTHSLAKADAHALGGIADKDAEAM